MEKIPEYISRHLEPDQPPVEKADSLLKPLTENIEYESGYGSFIAEKEGVRLNIDYGPTNSEEAMTVVSSSLKQVKKRSGQNKRMEGAGKINLSR